MHLFTSLSAAQAEQAERGDLRGDFVWVDGPAPALVDADTVWVTIEVPDNRMGKYEKDPDPGIGHREFLLPARVTNLHRARRVPRAG